MANHVAPPIASFEQHQTGLVRALCDQSPRVVDGSLEPDPGKPVPSRAFATMRSVLRAAGPRQSVAAAARLLRAPG